MWYVMAFANIAALQQYMRDATLATTAVKFIYQDNNGHHILVYYV